MPTRASAGIGYHRCFLSFITMIPIDCKIINYKSNSFFRLVQIALRFANSLFPITHLHTSLPTHIDSYCCNEGLEMKLISVQDQNTITAVICDLLRQHWQKQYFFM